MKKCLIILLGSFFILPASAQKTQQELLVGSWQLVSYSEENKTFPATEFSSIYSFYTDSTYQLRRSYPLRDSLGNPRKDTTLFEGGTWCLCCKGMVSFRQRHSIPQLGYWPADFYNETLKVLNDTQLVLMGIESDVKFYSNYKRVALLPKIDDNYVSPGPQVDYSFYFVKSTDTTKRKKIYSYSNISLVDFEDEGHNYRIFNFDGVIDSISDTAVYSLSHTDPLSGRWTFDERRMKTDIDHIRYIGNLTPFRDGLRSASGVIITISALTALIVAPLASMDHRYGGIRTERYFKWVGMGLIGMSVGIPLAILSKDRRYKVLPRYAPPKKDYWYIEKQKD